MSQTAAASGYRMPAEWEKQEAIWLAWPHQRVDWPGKFAPIPWAYTEIVRGITLGQRAEILVRSQKEQDVAREMLELSHVDLAKVGFHLVLTNRIWLRDSGPTFLKNKKGERMLLDWRFNAWAKYPNHRHDNAVPLHIAEATGLPVMQPVHKGRRVVLEGGSIDVDGKGTLLTTEECLLTEVQCRNPGFTRADYEQVFADWLGVSQVIWLGDGILGDDTHGHVDDLARFVSADSVATIVETDRKDGNYALLQDNLKRLKKARNAAGKPLNIIELPMPRPIYFGGERLPASYANFLITNAAVLVPTFNDVNDRLAMNLLAEAFPKHAIVGIHAVDLVLGQGTLHCLSQQACA